MPKKRFKNLPLPALYNESNLSIPEADPDILHRPLEQMPEFMRISLKALTAVLPLDIGDFAHKHRRVLVIDRNTVAELKYRLYDSGLKEKGTSGFLYCYSYEANLVAGHFQDIHEEGMWWWYRQWKTHNFLPEVKIGLTGRDDFQERILEQCLGPKIGVGHSQRPILLFVMYSPKVLTIGGDEGLETKVHQKLKSLGYWLKDANTFEETSPGTEWFEVPVGEAYSIATKYNQEIFNEYLSFVNAAQASVQEMIDAHPANAARIAGDSPFTES
ncbi:MAG: GIY-YIG nuclease family protein [Acaryochloris sp. RU_4_1]|nr:GIY-YIG nuclease family protein [Acaryochloris sp. RU_4_1]NJR54694.1 GIY-YIG nuclease family protein [Acaryochloris sp. CRU_2_0]